MNIAQANAVPLRDILQRIGAHPARDRARDLYYLSPWRAEKTASFHVHIPKNVWYDHGEGMGGDAVAFACTYLEKVHQSCQVSDGLQWIEKMVGGNVYYIPVRPPGSVAKAASDNPLKLKAIGPIKHVALIRYLESRYIPLLVAKQLFREAWIHNAHTDKSFFALALKNEDEGYELRNPFFKGSLSPKTISFIRGEEIKPDAIHVFEGSMDYLSLIARQNGKLLKGDSIILNSLSCLKDAYAYIKNYGYRIAYSWLDNDVAGLKAKQAFDTFIKTEQDLVHLPMNALYKDYKDVNEWHVASEKSHPRMVL